MNNDEQIEEYEISCNTSLSEEENKELKKDDVKVKYNFGFVTFFCGEIIRLFLLLFTFCAFQNSCLLCYKI